MVANDEYWKGKPEIKNVVFRPITNEATRTAALISGDVQLITDVPVRDADRIQKDSKLQFQGVSGLRFIYLTVDVTRPVTPAVEGGKNPFVDERVRKALRMSIDTDSIIKNVMEKDIPMIPLYFQEDAYGYSKTLEFTPRLDEWIYVYDIHFKK